MPALVSCRKVSMSAMPALVPCARFRSVLVSLAQGFDVGLGGEILFEQLGLLPHDGLGLAFGHTGAHQLVDRRMCIKDQWCHG